MSKMRDEIVDKELRKYKCHVQFGHTKSEQLAFKAGMDAQLRLTGWCFDMSNSPKELIRGPHGGKRKVWGEIVALAIKGNPDFIVAGMWEDSCSWTGWVDAYDAQDLSEPYAFKIIGKPPSL